MRKITLTILGLLLLWESPAFGGGRLFIGIGTAPFFIPRAAGFFHPPRARAHFFFQLSPRPFSAFQTALGPWGYQYPPPIGVPYSIPPQTIPHPGFSGTDPEGALYVEGYRVLPSGWLRVRVEPSDAEVLINGFPIAIDSASGRSASLGFPVGTHRVEVQKAGFQEFRSEVEITQARESRVEIRLSK